jgi:hypothetical protein
MRPAQESEINDVPPMMLVWGTREELVQASAGTSSDPMSPTMSRSR